MYMRGRFAATKVRTDLGWRRALELAAEGREATHGQGARWQPTGPVGLESPLGARRETTQAGGGSHHDEKRQGLGAEVHMIIRRQKNPVRRILEYFFRTHHL
jgi:hypothetical protein